MSEQCSFYILEYVLLPLKLHINNDNAEWQTKMMLSFKECFLYGAFFFVAVD